MVRTTARTVRCVTRFTTRAPNVPPTWFTKSLTRITAMETTLIPAPSLKVSSLEHTTRKGKSTSTVMSMATPSNQKSRPVKHLDLPPLCCCVWCWECILVTFIITSPIFWSSLSAIAIYCLHLGTEAAAGNEAGLAINERSKKNNWTIPQHQGFQRKILSYCQVCSSMFFGRNKFRILKMV